MVLCAAPAVRRLCGRRGCRRPHTTACATLFNMPPPPQSAEGAERVGSAAEPTAPPQVPPRWLKPSPSLPIHHLQKELRGSVDVEPNKASNTIATDPLTQPHPCLGSAPQKELSTSGAAEPTDAYETIYSSPDSTGRRNFWAGATQLVLALVMLGVLVGGLAIYGLSRYMTRPEGQGYAPVVLTNGGAGRPGMIYEMDEEENANDGFK